MKKTNEEILEFWQIGNRWLQMNQEESKFRYAVAKVTKKAERIRGHINDDIEDLNVKFALEAEDEKTKKVKLLKSDRGEYEFDREGMNSRNAAVRELMQKENEIEPHFVLAPPDLKSEFRIAFEGFVIEETNGSEPS